MSNSSSESEDGTVRGKDRRREERKKEGKERRTASGGEKHGKAECEVFEDPDRPGLRLLSAGQMRLNLCKQ